MSLLMNHLLVSLISVLMQAFAIVLGLFYIIKLFSFKAGSSLKIVFFGIAYYFSSSVLLYIGYMWVRGLPLPMPYALSEPAALAQALVLHLFFGFIAVLLCLRVTGWMRKMRSYASRVWSNLH